MRRSPLKRKRYNLKRTRLKKKSVNMELIIEIENLFRESLKRKRGRFCQLCLRRACGPVGLFHILPKGKYPKLRFHEANVLLVGWLPCHSKWHTDYFTGKVIEKRIQELRGRNYEDKLKIIDKGMPKLSMFQLRLIYQSVKQEGV